MTVANEGFEKLVAATSRRALRSLGRLRMSDLTPIIETMEHRWMRAWVNGDEQAIKAITAKDFVLLMASKPLTMLDRPSWLDAATTRYRASSYRFREVYVSSQSGTVLFAAPVELEARLDGRDWSGLVFVTDFWRKSRVRRGWKLRQRIMSLPDENLEISKGIRSLQLWR